MNHGDSFLEIRQLEYEACHVLSFNAEVNYGWSFMASIHHHGMMLWLRLNFVTLSCSYYIKETNYTTLNKQHAFFKASFFFVYL
jgi:hypothetical protein